MVQPDSQWFQLRPVDILALLNSVKRYIKALGHRQAVEILKQHIPQSAAEMNDDRLPEVGHLKVAAQTTSFQA